MTAHHRCCCGPVAECCAKCPEACRVIDLGRGVGQVRVRVFVDLEYSMDYTITDPCSTLGPAGGATGSVAYTISGVSDRTIDYDPIGDTCREFATPFPADLIAFTRTGAQSGEECWPDHDFERDMVCEVSGGVNSVGSVHLALIVWPADGSVSQVFEEFGGISLEYYARRVISIDPDIICTPFELVTCYGRIFSNQVIGGFDPDNPDVAFMDLAESGMEVLGLDSVCHADITLDINRSKSVTTMQEQPYGTVVCESTATITGTVRLLVEGIEPCDAEEVMEDLPECGTPAPDPEPTTCCEASGTPCTVTVTDPVPSITIDRLFGSIEWARDYSGNCDDGNIATPANDFDAGESWIGIIDILGATLEQAYSEDGCPVFVAHFELTNNITGTVPIECSPGHFMLIGAAGGTMTMTLDMEYRPGMRKHKCVLRLLDSAVSILAPPVFEAIVVLQDGASPAYDGSVARIKGRGFPVMHDLDMPSDWDVDSFESVCHTGVEFSGSVNLPPYIESGHQHTIETVYSVRFGGQCDLSGLEVCA